MVSAEPVALRNQQLTQARSDLGTFWHRVRSAAIADRLVATGVREVVDVGAGAGNLGGWLAANQPGIRYRFLEPMIDLSGLLVDRFGPSNLVTSTADIGDADAVTMLDVLEHIEGDREFLVDLFENMRPRSELLLTVPANQWLFSNWDIKLGHHRRYSRQTLRSVIESAGFDVSSVIHMFPELLPIAAVRKLQRGGQSGESAEFPELPGMVDRVAHAVSSTTSSLGRLAPFGTSLFAVARKG